jgi:hypothetical protein
MKKIHKNQASSALTTLVVVLLSGMCFVAPAEQARQKKTPGVEHTAKGINPAASPMPLADESLIDPKAADNSRKDAKASSGQNGGSQDQSRDASKKRNDRN